MAGYWTAEKGKNMRRFLEDFAKKSRFDPLLADNWYNITKEDISRYKVLQGRMREEREGGTKGGGEM